MLFRSEKFDEMIEELNIDPYSVLINSIEKIKIRYSVNVNIHNICAFSTKSLQTTGLCSYHDNPFCNYVKKNEDCFIKCVENKSKLIRKCTKIQKPFFGKCYMGIGEFIFPVFNQDNLIAIICIGTFCKDFNKSLVFNLSTGVRNHLIVDEMEDAFKKSVKTNDIEFSDMINDILLIENLINSIYVSYGKIYENLKNDEILLSTIEFINNNYMHKLTLKLLATNCHCNTSYLSRLFKEKCGINIIDYINLERVKKAKEMLSISSLRITEIALVCGFSTPDYFSQVFKKYTKLSPSEYRNSRK